VVESARRAGASRSVARSDIAIQMQFVASFSVDVNDREYV